MKRSFRVIIYCAYATLMGISIPILGYNQGHKIDSLRNLLKNQKEDSNKAIVLQNLAYQVYLNNNYDSAIVVNKLAVDLATTLNYMAGLEWEYRLYGNIYKSQGNYDIAINYDKKSLEIAEKLRDKRGIGFAYNNMGLVYMYQGNYPEALDCELKSLKIKEEIHDTKTITTAYGNIGSIYFSMHDYKNAFLYQQKALTTDSAAKDMRNQGIDYLNIGNIFRQTGEYEEALRYYFLALKLEEEVNDKYNQDIINGNIGSTYDSKKKPEEALPYYFKSLELAKEIGDKDGTGFTYGNIGAMYTSLKLYPIAKKYLDSAYILATSIGEKEILSDYYSHRSKLDSILGDYKSAFNNYENYRRYLDSLSNEEATKKIVSEQMQYEFDKRQAIQQAVSDAERHKQSIVIWSIGGGLFLVLVFAGFIFRSLRITRKQKQLIEIKNQETEEQKKIIEEKNKDILDSILYARRLQDAILPPLSLVKQYLPESFLFYKPKDIVAGDFYWMERAGDNILIAAADCTGHGVPGAMVSVVCSNALNRTVKEFKITEPGKILDKVRELVLETFEKSESVVQDGMDISLCCLNTRTNEAQWSGAYNSLWYVRKGEIYEVDADKQTVGKVDRPTAFNTHELKLQKGDTLYLFTDGYADQFGGPKGKKFKYKQLQDLLLANEGKPMSAQKEKLEDTFNKWKNGLEQVDDILIIGIRV
jgi:tetratricopeptide (TPR) repeat protein